jgi:hypothetical protein
MRWQILAMVMVAGCASDSPCDGVIDLGEDCDDGNGNPFDGCDCLTQPPWSPPLGERTTDGFVVVEDDGAWCWFQDERVVFAGDRLIASSISHGGDIQVSSYDVATGARDHGMIRRGFERDDHDAASLHLRADGRLTAFYTRHDGDPAMYWRTQVGEGLGIWGAEQRFTIDDDVTYSNPLQLADGLHLFFRGLSYNPTVAHSIDGETFGAPRQLMHAYTEGTAWDTDQRPYVKYVSDGDRSIHLFYTDGHPTELPSTSIFHAIYRDGRLHRSDGTPIEDALPPPHAGTSIHDGNALGSGWIWDAALDGANPVAVFATIRDDAHHYHYARWDGAAWQVHPIAPGGGAIYRDEAFYSGGIAIDPDDPRIVYFASNQDPITRASTRHFELYRAVTGDLGAHWTVTPLTRGSSVDNLRPVVPANHPTKVAVVWMQGTYHSYFDYDTRIVALLGDADAVVPSQAAVIEQPIARLSVADATLRSARIEASDGEVMFELWNAMPGERGEVTGVARGEDRMRVRVHGLEPATRYIARISSALPISDRTEPTLWFAAGTGDSDVTSHAFLGAHRPGNSRDGGDRSVDLPLTSDELGRIELVAHAMDESARTRLASVELYARSTAREIARFDVDTRGGMTAPGFVSLATDSTECFDAHATAAGITATVRSDRRDYTTEGGDRSLAEADAILGANSLVVDLDGLAPGTTYEVTVLTSALESHPYHAARWRLDEPGSDPRVLVGFQMNSRGLGPSNGFTFTHTARASTARLRASDVYWHRSTEPSVVILAGLVIRTVAP